MRGENARGAVPYLPMSCKRNRESRTGRDRLLAEIAASQSGVASVDQMRLAGITPRAAAHRAEQGGLHRVHRGVYAVGHRSIGRLGELRAALLACGPESLISHGTAAALWGLRDRWPASIDVLVRGQGGRKIDGIRCRRCRFPAASEVEVHEGLPCTTPARTLVDLAGMLGDASLQRAVERATVLKRLDLGALDSAMQAARGRRGIQALTTILAGWRSDDGSVPDLRSDFEALVLPRLLARGLPAPSCNETLRIGNERLMVDFLWVSQRLVLETDGRETHATPVAFQRDRRRDQLLIAAGYRVARTTWDQMQLEPDAVVARIGQALGG